jgi:hypothetical protein
MESSQDLEPTDLGHLTETASSPTEHGDQATRLRILSIPAAALSDHVANAALELAVSSTRAD